MMAYRQKRAEKMYEAFMREVKNKQIEFDERLADLEEDRLQWFRDTAFPLVSDYVVSCNQAEKIKYLVNGFLNITADPNIDENMILSYYDVLDRLSIADLVVLKGYSIWGHDGEDEENLKTMLSNALIQSNAVENIRSKLRSMSLLQSDADKQIEDALKMVDEVYDHLHNPKKNLRRSRIRTIFLKRYSLTKYGGRFLRFFCEVEER